MRPNAVHAENTSVNHDPSCFIVSKYGLAGEESPSPVREDAYKTFEREAVPDDLPDSPDGVQENRVKKIAALLKAAIS